VKPEAYEYQKPTRIRSQIELKQESPNFQFGKIAFLPLKQRRSANESGVRGTKFKSQVILCKGALLLVAFKFSKTIFKIVERLFKPSSEPTKQQIDKGKFFSFLFVIQPCCFVS